MNRIIILDQDRIERKLQRMAYEIWEHNSHEQEIILYGIEVGGVTLAQSLAKRLGEISGIKTTVFPLKMNKQNPLKDVPVVHENLNDKSIVLVDDVANSGKTLMYALRPFLNYTPKKVMIAVLVDRKHKSFPITADIIGHSIATTLQDHIFVEIEGDVVKSAYIE